MTDRRRAPAHVGRGAMMGLADLVPGISGGTVALLLGIHPRLVQAIAAIDLRLPGDAWKALRGDEEARASLRRLDLWFLVPLGLGIGLAILAGARAVHAGLEARPDLAMAFFVGLLVASVPVPWRHVTRHNGLAGAALVLGALAAGTLSLSPGASLPGIPLAMLLAGFIAVTAMLLPGISGSGLLVLLGAYDIVLGAAADLDLRLLLPFAVGAFVGLLAASKALRWLYAHAWDPTLAFLTGLIAGSVLRVWPWRSEAGFGAGVPVAPVAEDAVIKTALVTVGFLVVWGLDRWAGRRNELRTSVP